MWTSRTPLSVLEKKNVRMCIIASTGTDIQLIHTPGPGSGRRPQGGETKMLSKYALPLLPPENTLPIMVDNKQQEFRASMSAAATFGFARRSVK